MSAFPRWTPLQKTVTPITHRCFCHITCFAVNTFCRCRRICPTGISRLESASRGVSAKLSALTGAVEVLKSNTGALSDVAPGRSGDD